MWEICRSTGELCPSSPRLPYGRFVYFMRTRGVCGCFLSRTIPPSAFGSHLPLHNGGVVRGHRLFGELPVGFVGEGVKRELIVYAALSLSHLRCQLSPGESLGLSVLFVRWVTVWFVGVVCFFTGGKQITPSKRTIAVRLLSGAFPINCKHRITSRNAHPSPTDDRTFGALPVLFAHTP